MHTLTEIASNPSGWDSRKNYTGTDLDSLSNLYVVMTRSRDSSLLTECNWNEALERLGGESDNVIIHRFGHWACGWWEALCVTGNKQADGQAIVDQLECYPILNETKFSEVEWEAAQEFWCSLSLKKRVALCQEEGITCFAARHDWIPLDDAGSIFEYCRPE